MWKNISNRKKTAIICMVTFLLIFASMSVSHGSTMASSAIISVDPETITVGDPLPTEPFTVNITIKNVEGMFGWQVKIYFDAAILNCTGAAYSAGHVFSGKQFVPVSAMIEEDYVLFGATLYYEEDLFSGNGTLCDITFIGKIAGTSDLEFDDENTYLLDFDLEYIDSTLEHGSVTVIPEFQPLFLALLLIIATLAAAILSKTAKSQKWPHAATIKR